MSYDHYKDFNRLSSAFPAPNLKFEETCLAWCHLTCVIPCSALPLRLAFRLQTDKTEVVSAFARHVFAHILVADECAALDTAAYNGNSAQLADGLRITLFQIIDAWIFSIASCIST